MVVYKSSRSIQIDEEKNSIRNGITLQAVGGSVGPQISSTIVRSQSNGGSSQPPNHNNTITTNKSNGNLAVVKQQQLYPPSKTFDAEPPKNFINHSKLIKGLTKSQSSLALISALLSGLAFQNFTSFDFASYLSSGLVSPECDLFLSLFSICNTIGICTSLFVALNCTILEQNGQVSHSLSLSFPLHSPSNIKYQKAVKSWYFENTRFTNFRKMLVSTFNLSFLLFAIAAGSSFYLRLVIPPNSVSSSSSSDSSFGGIITSNLHYTCLSIFVLFGLIMGCTARWMNRMFVGKVLLAYGEIMAEVGRDGDD